MGMAQVGYAGEILDDSVVVGLGDDDASHIVVHKFGF